MFYRSSTPTKQCQIYALNASKRKTKEISILLCREYIVSYRAAKIIAAGGWIPVMPKSDLDSQAPKPTNSQR